MLFTEMLMTHSSRGNTWACTALEGLGARHPAPPYIYSQESTAMVKAAHGTSSVLTEIRANMALSAVPLFVSVVLLVLCEYGLGT
jgi:hypothetical protein